MEEFSSSIGMRMHACTRERKRRERVGREHEGRKRGNAVVEEEKEEEAKKKERGDEGEVMRRERMKQGKKVSFLHSRSRE